jgi:hypothetical protein
MGCSKSYVTGDLHPRRGRFDEPILRRTLQADASSPSSMRRSPQSMDVVLARSDELERLPH